MPRWMFQSIEQWHSEEQSRIEPYRIESICIERQTIVLVRKVISTDDYIEVLKESNLHSGNSDHCRGTQSPRSI